MCMCMSGLVAVFNKANTNPVFRDTRAMPSARQRAHSLTLSPNKKARIDAISETNDGRKKNAWVTLLTASTVRYTSSVAAQIIQIRKYSQDTHYTLVTEDVEKSKVDFLREYDTTIVRVKNIVPPFAIRNPVWNSVFSKFHIWNESLFEPGLQILTYMEYDAFPLTSAATRIMGQPLLKQCESTAMCMLWESDIYNLGADLEKGMFNTGVISVNVLRTRGFLQEVLGFMQEVPASYAPELPEQELLRDFFKKKYDYAPLQSSGNCPYHSTAVFLTTHSAQEESPRNAGRISSTTTWTFTMDVAPKTNSSQFRTALAPHRQVHVSVDL